MQSVVKKIFQRLLTFCTVAWLVSISLSSCEKGDQFAPLVDIELPSAYSFYEVGDTIKVRARVRDERHIKSVSVSLLGPKYGVQGTTIYPIITNPYDFTFEVELVISNKYLSSGDYLVNVDAFDGSNSTWKVKDVVIAELPLERERLVWLSQSTSSVEAYSYEWSGSPQLIRSFPGDHSGSGVSSRFGQLYHACRTQGSYTATDLTNYQLAWDYPSNNSTAFPYYNAVHSGNVWNYVSFYEGFIKGYDEFGSQKFTGIVQEEYTVTRMVEVSDRLFAYFENKIPIGKKMVVYNSRTGAILKEVSVGGEIVAILPKVAYDVFVFWNEGGQGQLKVYDYSANAFYQPRPLPPGTIITACHISEDTYALAMSDGVNFYKYSTNSITPLMPGVIAQWIVYEKIANELIVASGNQVIAFDAQTGLQKYAISAPNYVPEVHVVYNK